MADILFRLPTKANKFGYVELTFTPADLGIASMGQIDPETLGRVYDSYVQAFQKGETEDAVAALSAAVAADLGGFDTHPQEGGDEPSDADVVAAHDAAEALLKSELGATVVEKSGAPWERPAIPTPAKEWENDGPPVAVADIDW